MDFIKISLWLSLAMISVYKSECKSFNKYLGSTGETRNEYDENCFCFKNPGQHQIVPEILNQKNDNLERLIIYLYKDKITGQVKMYMPNEEKQALVPDLAFEVGDKLVTVDDAKIIDIFPHTINAVVDQQPHIANIVLPKEQNEFQYDDHDDHVHPQFDKNGVLSQENNTPDIYHINPYENYIDTDSVQAEKLNKHFDVMYDDTLNKQPQVENNRKPYKITDIIPELIYGGHDSPEASFEKLIPSKTNVNDFLADTKPASDWNILPDYTIHGQPELSSVDYNRVPANEINVPGKGMYPDNAQYENPFMVTNDVLEPLNIPGDVIDHDNINYLVQYEHPHIDTIGVSKQINVPGKVMYPDNVDYHGLQKQPHVDTISVLKPLHVPGEASYEQPYVDASGVSKQINVPGQAMYPDNVNYHGQHEKPYIDYMKVSKQTNVPFEVSYPDNINYQAQHEQPYIGTDGVSKQPNVVKYPDVHYHVQHKQPLPETNDELINVPGEYIYDYFPHVSDQGIPSKSSDYTFIMDSPDGNWNIPSVWNYDHTLDPHRNGKQYVDHINGSDKTANHVPLRSSEESEESGSSEGHNYKAIAESGSDQNVDSSEENTSKSRTRNENNSFEYSQSNESDSSQENEMIESREPVKYSDELEMNAVVGDTKYKTKSRNHIANQYETFDKWFIHQMQRFQTFTEHDKAINIVDIERYILNILHDNGMHVTSEGVLTDSFGTALDVHNLHLRPILIGNPLAFGSIMKQITTHLVIPANMAYLQAILVTNAHPSMILGIIPIGKTVIPPSVRNTFSTVLKPLIRHDSSIVLANHPTLASSGKHHKSTNQWQINKSKNSGQSNGKTVLTFLKKTPVIVHHRHRQPVKSIKIYGAKDKKVSFLPKNSAEAVNKLMSSLSGPKGLISSADATNKLLAALRSDGSLFTSSEDSYELDEDEDDIAERIVGGSAATGSGAPLSMKGRMKDY